MMNRLIVFLVIVSLMCILLIDAKKSGKGKSKGGNPFAELKGLIAALEKDLRAEFEEHIAALQAQINGTKNCCSNVTDLEERIDQLESAEAVAFHAYRSTSDGSPETINLGANAVVSFPSILLNDGNGYDNVTSTFTAPVEGVYLALVTMCVGNGVNTVFEIKKGTNALPDAITNIRSIQGTCSSFSVVLKLDAGETVLVTTGNTTTPHTISTTAIRRSSFGMVKIA